MMYGWIDRAAPSRLYSRPDASLGDVWRELVGVGNVAIVRLSDNAVIARRGINAAWEMGL
jgi:hypothetical protein